MSLTFALQQVDVHKKQLVIKLLDFTQKPVCKCVMSTSSQVVVHNKSQTPDVSGEHAPCYLTGKNNSIRDQKLYIDILSGAGSCCVQQCVQER